MNQGEQVFIDAIEQLLGYLTWRDTKAAIVLFNTNKDPSKVVNQIPRILAAHPSFMEPVTNTATPGFRCRLHHPLDHDKEVLLTVLVFDVPV